MCTDHRIEHNHLADGFYRLPGNRASWTDKLIRRSSLTAVTIDRYFAIRCATLIMKPLPEKIEFAGHSIGTLVMGEAAAIKYKSVT